MFGIEEGYIDPRLGIVPNCFPINCMGIKHLFQNVLNKFSYVFSISTTWVLSKIAGFSIAKNNYKDT